MLGIVGNLLTPWFKNQLPNLTWNNISVSSHIDFSWLPPISMMIASLIIGFIAYFFVQRAQQNAIKEINAANQNAQNETAEWAEMCEGLKDYLTPYIDGWEMQKKTGNRGQVTKDTDMTVMTQRKLFYDKVNQRLKEYQDKTRLNQAPALKQSELDNANLELIRSKEESNNGKEELEKLIKPLYISLDSCPDNPIKGAHLAFGEIKQYGNLAQPELRNLLSQYCDIREENPKPETQPFMLYKMSLAYKIRPNGRDKLMRTFLNPPRSTWTRLICNCIK